MCQASPYTNSGYAGASTQALPQSYSPPPIKPEQRIADIISKEAGAYIHPQVIRLIVKYNWRELSKAAHEIHGS